MQDSGNTTIWTDNQPNLCFSRGLPRAQIHLEKLQCTKWAPCAAKCRRYGKFKDIKSLRSLHMRAGKILKCKYKNTLKVFSRMFSEQDFEKLSIWYKTCSWVTNLAGGKGLLPEVRMVRKILTSALPWWESWIALEAAKNNYFSIAGSKGGKTWETTSSFLSVFTAQLAWQRTDLFLKWRKEKLALEAAFLPEMTPHLEEGGMRKLHHSCFEHKKGFWFFRTDTQALILYLLSF